ncbi:hypothetical protein GJAV_G00184230 [Gymnothorax javanicus]|nr:hypothetical protein GJAV_G00184230 [Gymnothorax javanicus]
MGSNESATRKVSFALDDEDNVRVLRGVKLSEELLQRMRTLPREMGPRPPPPDAVRREEQGPTSTTPEQPRPSVSEPLRAPEPPQTAKTPQPSLAEVQEELRKRYEREQTIMREELARITWRERVAAREDLSRALRREREYTNTEAEKAKNLEKQLERKEAELKKQETFYREKLAELGEKNLDYYKRVREQFREAADKMEAHVRPRNAEPVCPTLQNLILQCYRDNRHQTLCCSDLAKEYMQCIDAAKKNLLVNRG